MNKEGSLSINSENIFPIIKKWLYSDHDIFFRELVSNGCDAITKLKKLDIMGEVNLPADEKFKIEVIADNKNNTLTFIDNGIGMTADEVDEYINQIAFSGAAAFMEEYKDKTSNDQIIGHFGLGFYSAFMVADHVTIETLSYKDGASAVKWDCADGMEFTMSECDKDTRGTKITLYINDDSVEFTNYYRALEVLNKYCSFMPVEIFLTDPNKEEKIESTADESDESDKTDSTEENNKPTAINDVNPLWNKHPNECSDEEYKAFYQKVFMDYKEPLFWIHLNMDYPFNLKGILYFPKINMEYESAEGVIKLYNNQVFIADNIKEVIPEFLMLLKGVIDCPDLPLNVSRSALQNDGFVKKISDYITKKVADKLSGMCKTKREDYEKYWDDISPFIKYGCLKDEKFCEKMSDYVLFKNIDDKFLTFKDCLENNKDENENTIFYTDNPLLQSQYINMFKEQNIDVIVLNDRIDTPFIQQLEMKNEGVKFKRVDGDLGDTFSEKLSEDDEKKYKDALTEAFKKALGRDEINIEVKKMKDSSIPCIITVNEDDRRMNDMMKMYGLSDMGSMNNSILTLNSDNTLVQYLIDKPDGKYNDIICKHLYDLAVISNTPLNAESMTAFINRNNEILKLLIDQA